MARTNEKKDGLQATTMKNNGPVVISNESQETCEPGNGTISIAGKITVFVLFPMLAGLSGLFASYLRSINGSNQQVSIDRDFVLPFLLALAFSVVVGFQTSNFRTKNMNPIVSWPKVRRIKKVVLKSASKQKTN